jgi:hypothetical protein
MQVDYTSKDVARFWAKVDKSGDCWLWTASADTAGYGQINISGKMVMAHRFAYLIMYGDPGALFCCHKCDTPLCVNPHHLFLGTNAQNMADMVAKGRSAKGDASTSRLYPELRQRGEAHPKSKLTTAQVVEIRKLLADNMSERKIAAKMGVTRGSITAIKHGISWKHVP